jgi:hypothetical protein
MRKVILILIYISFFSTIAQEVSTNKQIFVDLKINDMEKKFIFDTGAPTLFFDKTIEIDKNKPIILYDADKVTDTFYFPKRKVDIDIKHFKITSSSKKSLIISRKTPPETFNKENVSGIFGNNFINNYDWYFDSKTSKISIIKDKDKINRNDFYEIALTNQNMIECSFITDNNSVVKDTFLIDTGYIGFLTSRKTTSFNNYLLALSKNVSLTKVAIDTSKIIKTEFSIGNLKLKNTPIVIKNNDNSLNLLGVAFLKCFENVYFLYSENKLLLKKTEIIEHNVYNPIYLSNKIYGYLQNDINSFCKELDFKRWEIDKEINPSEIDFQKITFPISITTN